MARTITDFDGLKIDLSAIDNVESLKGPKGDTGDQGPKGDTGSDAEVTNENVIAALGYTPVDESIIEVATSTDLINTLGYTPANQSTIEDQISTKVPEPTAAGSWIRTATANEGSSTVTCSYSQLSEVLKANITLSLSGTSVVMKYGDEEIASVDISGV